MRYALCRTLAHKPLTIGFLMMFLRKIIIHSYCLGLTSCSTYHYYPTYETGLQSPATHRDATFKDLRLQVSCTAKDELDQRIPAPGLCAKIGDWINLYQAKLLSDQDDGETDESPDLKIELVSSGLIRAPETFESLLHLASFGFYPTQTDRWFKTEIRIFNAQHQLLEHGQFKALLREYYGWGYSLLHVSLKAVHVVDKENAYANNSRDFYVYFGKLLRRASSQNEISQAAAENGVGP